MMSSVNMHVYNTEHNEPSLAQVYKHDAPSSIASELDIRPLDIFELNKFKSDRLVSCKPGSPYHIRANPLLNPSSIMRSRFCMGLKNQLQ